MNVSEHHNAPYHYLFNKDLVAEDLSLFDELPGASSNNMGRGTVYFRSVNTRAGDSNVVVKQYRRGGMVRHFNRDLYWHSHYSKSRVWLEFMLLAKMTTMGLPVPVPIAGRVKRKFSYLFESTIVTQEIEQAETFADCLKQHSGLSSNHALWQKTGETIKRFHNANIYHADLNASNILITKHHDIYLIDFDKGQHSPNSTSDWKNKNLDRLQRSLLKYQRADSQFQYSAERWAALLAGYER